MAISDADRLFLVKKNKTVQIALICPCITSSFNNVITIANKTDHTPKSLLQQSHKERIHEQKTNAWKHHLEKIDHKHNPTPSGHYSKTI